MKRVLWLVCVGLAVASPLSAQEPGSQVTPGRVGFPRVDLRLDQLAPKDWKVSDIETDVWPYGYLRPVRGAGLAITLRGPLVVHGFKGEPALELLNIWIMPKEYQAVAPRFPETSFPPAELLGLANRGPDKRYLIYVMRTGIKSWPAWEKDIRNYFGIQSPNNAAQPQMPPPPEPFPYVPPLPGPVQRAR